MSFKKATKFESRLRMAIAGPSGSGKTWTALTLATALADGGSVAVIDTERGSASKYADVFSFDVMNLDTFHPDQFVQGIHEAEQAGYSVLIIDSLTHAWNGTGGLLDIVDSIAKRKYQNNTFAAWKDATPIQNTLIDAITRSSLHIIATMRSKQEYAVEVVNGKSTPKKLGMAPIQRDGLEYEFDVAVDMDIDNTMIVQKSRCPALSGAIIAKPDAKVADILKAWLSGVPAPAQTATRDLEDAPASPQQLSSIQKLCEHLGKSAPAEELTYPKAKELIAQLSAEYRERQQKSQPTSSVNAPMASQLRKLFESIGSTLETAQKMTFGKVVASDNLTPEDCARLKQVYDAWKVQYDKKAS